MTRRLTAAIIACALPGALGGVALARAGGHTINEHEYSLSPRSVTVSKGRVTLTVHNTGRFVHALAIEKGSAGGKDLTSRTVAPGRTVRFTVTVHRGRFELYCPIDGHKGKGMKGTLVVR